MIECVNASEVRRILFQVTPRRKKNASRPQNACNPKYETRSRKPKDLEKSGRKKKLTHTTDSTMGVSTSYLSISLFSLARWVQMISHEMNFDAFVRLYLRAMSVCARVCTAKFSAPPGRFIFRARKNLRVKRLHSRALACTRIDAKILGI